ncbi:MAG: glycosyltransferase family 2 protein [Acidobacteriota bacterium]
MLGVNANAALLAGPESTGDTMRWPSVSVIVPCRNEQGHLQDCLESILIQDYPTIQEIFFMDGQSEDRTRELIVDAARRDSRIKLLDNPWKVVPHALNIGIEASSGSFIIRMDAHSTYPSDYVRRCVEGLVHSGAWNYGGVFVNRTRTGAIVARAIAALTNHPFGVGNAHFRHGTEKRRADTVPFGCFPRDLFSRVGLFDERLVRNQDNEFNARILKAGGTILLDPEIHIFYYNQESVRGLFRQALWTGSWNAITHFLCPHAFRWRHALPGAFTAGVVTLLAASAGSLALGVDRVAFAGLVPLLAYFLMTVACGVDVGRREGWRIGTLVPALGFGYHFTYGLGYLWGWVLVATGQYRKRIPLSRVNATDSAASPRQCGNEETANGVGGSV